MPARARCVARRRSRGGGRWHDCWSYPGRRRGAPARARRGGVGAPHRARAARPRHAGRLHSWTTGASSAACCVRRRPHRPGRKPRFDRAAYRRRGAIAYTVGALEEARAVATRYERLAIHSLAVVKLGMIHFLVRRLGRPLSDKA